MSRTTTSSRTYDHRIREAVCETGNPKLFQANANSQVTGGDGAG